MTGYGVRALSGGFSHRDLGGFLVPQDEHGVTQPDDYIGGRIQRPRAENDPFARSSLWRRTGEAVPGDGVSITACSRRA